jgi:hypothetical protein
MDIVSKETGGKSYRSSKYSLDHLERSPVEHGAMDKSFEWARRGETKDIRGYTDLLELSNTIRASEDPLLTYFLDGSRQVYKVDDMGFESGKRMGVYPIIAGQIGVGCCKRINKRMSVERFDREIVVSMPDIAEPDGKKHGFLEAMVEKLNEGVERTGMIASGWRFSEILSYKTAKEDEKEYSDKGVARIQMKMMAKEQEMVSDLVKEKKINSERFLVKDGSLEYRPTDEMRKNKRELDRFKNNYNYVIGVSKRFNPEVCVTSGNKPNPGFIADLPTYCRTPVAYFKNEDYLGDIGFAVWYVRIREKSRTQTPFDGVIKVEKILVTDDEIEKGMESDLVDTISAQLINERSPVCYGSDVRWANHLYPIYLTEKYVKSHYLGTECFLHLF